VSLLEAVRTRQSYSKVSEEAPTREELLPLIEAAASIADHGSMRPWRLIELRGDARLRLGAALAKSAGAEGKDAAKLAEKPLRASLLIAVVGVYKPSFKVPEWEQEAVASGVAHTLSLLLDDAGWGVFWRTGIHTRSVAVHEMHELAPNEKLLGWLYVGGKPEKSKPAKKDRFNASRALTSL
jgi:nitroreductase